MGVGNAIIRVAVNAEVVLYFHRRSHSRLPYHVNNNACDMRILPLFCICVVESYHEGLKPFVVFSFGHFLSRIYTQLSTGQDALLTLGYVMYC